MLYELPDLPFEKKSLEPNFSSETIDYHYGKHHQAYVNNLNKLVPGTEFEGKSLEEIIKTADGGIFNNAAQIYNHTFYWNCLSPSGGGEPSGKLADAINSAFGSFEDFKKQFSQTAATLFGSGWAWLVKTSSGELKIKSMPNAGCPIKNGDKPLLTVDVWEHAYYIDFRNARPNYIETFWKLVNWDFVSKNLG